MTDEQHRTHVELSSNRAGEAVYYAWCSHPDCDWYSAHRKVQLAVEEFGRRHEQKANK